MRIKDGVKKNGRIVARQIKSIRESGAYTTLNSYVVDKHCFLATGPYFVPNIHIQGYCVYTNKSPASAMRGFGVTPSTFATEVQMNKVAEAVGDKAVIGVVRVDRLPVLDCKSGDTLFNTK